MADFFVDKLLEREELRNQWKRITKLFIKKEGFKKTLEQFLELAEEVNEVFYKTFKCPAFKGDLKITDIANEFGIKPLNRNLRICPFHADKSPSLSLDNEKGVFNCFGCGVKGNIITFYAMLKRLKNGTIIKN